jgi:hypothetical protein
VADFWLSSPPGYTTLFEIVVASFVGIAFLTTIQIASDIKSSPTKNVSELFAYTMILAYPICGLIIFYLLWGAMVPTSNAHQGFVQVMNILLQWKDYAVPEMGFPDGPFGTCIPSPQYLPDPQSVPDTIGVL